MTVQTNTNVASFNGNAVTQIFPIAFKFNKDTDLVVLLVDDASGSASLLTLNSDYTVSGEGDEEGGLINVVVAPAIGKRLSVTRVVDILQLTDLRNQGKFFAETHEDALDLLTMIAQQHESKINSSLRVAESDPVPARIPAVAQRANKILSFDVDGNPQVVAPVTDSSTELRQELASSEAGNGADLVARAVNTDGHQDITGAKTLVRNQAMQGFSWQVLKDSTPLNYSNTEAASVLQWRDSGDKGDNILIPGAVFQFNSTGNGVVNAATELSRTIWQGLFAYCGKSGDGSAHSFTATGELKAAGPEGYNELGLYQGEMTNIGSALGTMSGVELLLKDSPDGGVSTYSTKMQGVVSRIAKYNPTIRGSHNFYASSEGSKAPNSILGVNPTGLHSWQRGIDLNGATFTTGQAMLSPNNTSLAWMDASGSAKPVIGIGADNSLFVKSAGGSAYIQDINGSNKIGVTAEGSIALQNLTLSASAAAGTNGALPTQVSGYIPMVVNGANVKIPYYN